jgi:streptogramin lyase
MTVWGERPGTTLEVLFQRRLFVFQIRASRLRLLIVSCVTASLALAGCAGPGTSPPISPSLLSLESVPNARCSIGKIKVFKGPAGGGGGVNITTGLDKDLWYGDTTLNKIVRMTKEGRSRGYPIPTSGARPEGIAEGHKRMWFTEWSQAKIGSLTAKGRIREFVVKQLSGNQSQAVAMVSGPDKRIWFTTANYGLGAATAKGKTVLYTTGIDSEDPSGLGVGPDKNLWYTTFHGPDIGKMTTHGVATNFNVGALGGFGLTAGPDGRVWFADPGHNRIGAISTSGTGLVYYSTTGSPFNLVTAPNHYMYFTTATSAKVGRISVTGEIKECAIHAPQLFDALGITIGPDKNVWILDNEHSQVARLTI